MFNKLDLMKIFNEQLDCMCSDKLYIWQFLSLYTFSHYSKTIKATMELSSNILLREKHQGLFPIPRSNDKPVF
jgi:hypothetical protein